MDKKQVEDNLNTTEKQEEEKFREIVNIIKPIKLPTGPFGRTYRETNIGLIKKIKELIKNIKDIEKFYNYGTQL